MSKQQKNLSLTTLKKQNAKTYKDKKQIHFANGDKLDIDVVFQPTKIESVIQETLEILTKVAERKDKDIDAGTWLVVTMASVIKTFTSIETDAVGFDGLIELSVALKNAEYYDQIVSAFDQVELEKTFMKINDALQLVNQQINLLKEKQEVVKSEEEVVEKSGK